ncbi:hypothetical protein EU245_01935 [Lentibacillus lipolyticus]|nr:hypothetical protein EU245_01935 [Lentibacillus lipolyticus]
MGELANCAQCGTVFVKNIRDVCSACYRKEEEAFTVVYQFLRKRENREATLSEIVNATVLGKEMIIKFIKTKRLRTSEFPKLTYPCERCGVDIVRGRFCADCTDELKKDLERYDSTKKDATERKPERVYYAFDRND